MSDHRRALHSLVAGALTHGVPGLLVLVVLALAGCGETTERNQDAVPPTLAGESQEGLALAVTHGGVGSPLEWSPDCQQAAEQAAQTLDAGGTALDAAVAGTMVMEDNPRFNAGTGANIRLDGRTIQMDAAVMTSDGAFAAVAVIERVRNPVAVARAVLDTPHRLLAGEGATLFAHRAGFADVVPTCPEAEAKYRQRIAALLAGRAGGGFDDFDWRRYWNYPGPPPATTGATGEMDAPGDGAPPQRAGDTVGTVTRDPSGNFAATLSTGGTSITLYGRVGDVPIYGCGLYAGPAGAVACTGFGEEIIRHTMARTVYEMLAAGVPAREAVRRGVSRFPEEYSLGLIAVDRGGWGVGANRSMAHGMAPGSPSR
jgi:beta-aspartyl-peptidase (threonine type)